MRHKYSYGRIAELLGYGPKRGAKILFKGTKDLLLEDGVIP
jgi:hypothetical protein